MMPRRGYGGLGTARPLQQSNRRSVCIVQLVGGEGGAGGTESPLDLVESILSGFSIAFDRFIDFVIVSLFWGIWCDI